MAGYALNGIFLARMNGSPYSTPIQFIEDRGSYLVNLSGIFETLCHLPDSINLKGFKSIACSIFYTLTKALFINNTQQCFLNAYHQIKGDYP